MIRPPSTRRSLVLLAATAIWLIAVTLCSTRAMTAPAHVHDGDHSDHGHHSSAPTGPHGDNDCGCESFNTFPSQSATQDLAKAPLPPPAIPLLVLQTWSDEIFLALHVAAPFIQSTSPPERLSFAELVLQRCLLSHAPPGLTT